MPDVGVVCPNVPEPAVCGGVSWPNKPVPDVVVVWPNKPVPDAGVVVGFWPNKPVTGVVVGF